MLAFDVKSYQRENRHISYQSSDPLISKASISKGHSASSWQVLLDAQVCASPKAGASLQAPLSYLRAREEESGAWEHIWDRDCYSPTCAFSLGCCSHHPIHVMTARTVLVPLPRPLSTHKGRKQGAGRLPEGLVWKLSQAQHCQKGWKMRKTRVCTLALWVLVADLRGSLKPRSPTAQVRVPKVRTAGAATSEEQSNYFFVVYHQLIACSGPRSPPANLYEHCPRGARGCAHLSLCSHCIQSDPGAGNHSCIGRAANSPKITERRNKGTEVWGHGRRWLMSCTSLMVASVLLKCLPVIRNTHVCKTYVLQSISHTLKMWAPRNRESSKLFLLSLWVGKYKKSIRVRKQS